MKGLVDISGNLNMINRLFASSMVGMIGWFASENIPPGWLVCDGGKYTKALYTDLSNCIGNTYNHVDISLSDISFNVPDLTNQFIRSISNKDVADLGNTETYKTGKPTQKSNFQVSLSGEHIHDVDLSGSHSHDYEYNETNNEETSYYINNSSTEINNKNIRDEEYLDNLTLFYNQGFDSVSASDFPVTLTNGNGVSSWTDEKILNIPYENNATGYAYVWEYRWFDGWNNEWTDWEGTGNTGYFDDEVTITNGQKRSDFKNKLEYISYPDNSRQWYHDSAKDNYVRYKPDGTKNSDLNFINGSSTEDKDITFDKSGNHTHVVDDKENTHSHTLSNWHNESVPKHTILLPCIKY